MTDPLSSAERSEVERACERLIHRYARALDTGDIDAAADCFALEGAMARPLAPDRIIHGREAIRASLHTRPKGLVTKHLSTNIMIEVQSREHAQGLSCLTMIATTPEPGSAPPHGSAGPLWFGEWRDRFVREQGQWKFLERLGSIQLKFPAV